MLGLKGRSLSRNQGLNHQSLHRPRSVRKPLPCIGVKQSRTRLLKQPTEDVVALVNPGRRFHQSQIRSEPFTSSRPKHFRHRRCLWDHLRPRLSPAAPVPVSYTTQPAPSQLPSPTRPSWIVEFEFFFFLNKQICITKKSLLGSASWCGSSVEKTRPCCWYGKFKEVKKNRED